MLLIRTLARLLECGRFPMMMVKRKRAWRFTTRLRLVLAGWRRNRNVWSELKLPGSLVVFPEAKRVLAEFGGLKFGNRMECVSLDPSLGEEVAEQIRLYEEKLGTRLYPVGVMEHQDRHYLLVDETGIIYTLIEQPEPLASSFELEPLASSFDRAIEYLIRRTGRREMNEDLQAINMLGKVWRLEGGA